MCENPDWRNPIPRNSIPNPERISPIFQNLFFSPIIRISTPAPIRGRAKSSILIFSPMSATSHPVIVVPTFVPNITQSELTKVMIPAFTKPIVKSVVAVEDWSIAVARNPERNPLNPVLVPFSSIRASAGPDAAFSHSDMSIMPRRKSPIPQNIVQ